MLLMEFAELITALPEIEKDLRNSSSESHEVVLFQNHFFVDLIEGELRVMYYPNRTPDEIDWMRRQLATQPEDTTPPTE